MRVLGEEIAAAIGSAGHLAELRRTLFGSFEIGAAVPLDAWDPAEPRGFVPLTQALGHLPAIAIDARTAAAVIQGKTWVLAKVTAQGGEATLVDPTGEIVAVLVRKGGTWTYGRVLHPHSPLLDSSPVLLTTR